MRAVLIVALGTSAACGRVAFDGNMPDGGMLDTGSGSGIPLTTELPAGGEIDLVTAGPDGHWYAISPVGDGFHSADGQTWRPCDDNIVVSDIAVAADGTVYASGQDVHFSGDHCAGWQLAHIDRYTQTFGVIGTDIYALTDIGLEKRAGGAWTPIPTPLDTAIFTAFAGVSGNILVGTNAGLLHSTDGTTFATVGGTLPTQNYRGVAASSTRSYVITQASGASNGAVGCSDGTAQAWTACTGPGGTAIAVDPGNDQHAFAAIYDSLLETHDAFQTMQLDQRGGAMGAAIVHDLSFQADGSLVAGTDRGVFYAAPGTTAWEARDTGLDTWTINDIAQSGDEVYLATPGGVIHGARGQSYTASFEGMTPNTEVNAIAVAPDGTVIAGGRQVWGSTDHGATWSVLVDLDSNEGYRAWSVALDGARAYAGTATKVWSADPPYTTWTPHPFAPNHIVSGLAVVAGEVWAATDGGVFVSRDQGATWQAVPALPSGACMSIAALRDGGLIVTTDLRGYISDPARATWQPTSYAYRYTIDGDTIIAATDEGALISHDRGATWIQAAGAYRARSVFVDHADGTILVGSLGKGLAKVPMR